MKDFLIVIAIEEAIFRDMVQELDFDRGGVKFTAIGPFV